MLRTVLLSLMLCQTVFSRADAATRSSSQQTLQACVTEALLQSGERVREVSGDEGRITTGFKKVTVKELHEVAALPEPKERWVEGQYRLQIALSQDAITVNATVFAREAPGSKKRPPYPMGGAGPTDWRPVKSTGSLERKWREILHAHCGQ